MTVGYLNTTCLRCTPASPPAYLTHLHTLPLAHTGFWLHAHLTRVADTLPGYRTARCRVLPYCPARGSHLHALHFTTFAACAAHRARTTFAMPRAPLRLLPPWFITVHHALRRAPHLRAYLRARAALPPAAPRGCRAAPLSTRCAHAALRLDYCAPPAACARMPYLAAPYLPFHLHHLPTYVMPHRAFHQPTAHCMTTPVPAYGWFAAGWYCRRAFHLPTALPHTSPLATV